MLPFSIQSSDAKDAWKPNHDGEDTKLLCNKGDTAPDCHYVPGHQADRGGAGPRHSCDIWLHSDFIQNPWPAQFPGAGFQKPEPGHRGHVLECHSDRTLRSTPGKLAPVLPTGSDPLCEWGASHHRPGRGAGPGTGLPGFKAYRHGQALLFQPHQRIPLPEEARKQRVTTLSGQIQGQNSRADRQRCYRATERLLQTL